MPLNLKSRARRILLAYCLENLDLKRAALRGIFPGPKGVNHSRLNNYLMNKEELSTQQDPQIADIIAATLTAPKHRKELQEDHGLLRPLILEAGLGVEIPLEMRDERALDVELLRLLALQVNEQGEQHQQNVHRTVGGFWYIVRQSTEETGAGAATPADPSDNPATRSYNVSLLNIKPLDYTSSDDGDYEKVRTYLMHFSVRSRSTLGGRVTTQIYRGRVIEVGGVINFLGNRYQEGRPKLQAMAWSYPAVTRHHGTTAGADVSEGIITTVNSSDVTVTGPVVGLRIRTLAGLQPMPERVPGQADEAWAREHARWHGAFIEKALEAVGAYSGAALARRLQGINPRATIDERIEALDVIIRSGREQGYFLIP